jgi:hypothetical protein
MLDVKYTKNRHYIDRYKQFSTICIITIICTLYTYIVYIAGPADRNAPRNHIVDVSHASRVPSPTRIILLWCTDLFTILVVIFITRIRHIIGT